MARSKQQEKYARLIIHARISIGWNSALGLLQQRHDERESLGRETAACVALNFTCVRSKPESGKNTGSNFLFPSRRNFPRRASKEYNRKFSQHNALPNVVKLPSDDDRAPQTSHAVFERGAFRKKDTARMVVRER